MDAGSDGLASVTYLLSAVQLKLARGQGMTDVDVCVLGANCRQRDYANCWVCRSNLAAPSHPAKRVGIHFRSRGSRDAAPKRVIDNIAVGGGGLT